MLSCSSKVQNSLTQASDSVVQSPQTTHNTDTTPTIRVANIVDGLFVNLYADSSCSGPIQSAGVSTGESLDITSAPLSVGTYEFHTVTQDSHGNLSGCSASSVTYTLDAIDNHNPAFLVISDGPTYDFGVTLTGNIVAKEFTVQNVGGADASSINGMALSAPYRYEGGSYPGKSGTCGTELAINRVCTIAVEYVPFSTGTNIENLTVQYFNGIKTVTSVRTIRGKGYFYLPSLALEYPAATPNNDTTPTIRVAGIVDGLLINLYADSSCSGSIKNAGLSSGALSKITSSPLVDGTYEFHVMVQDSYGNLSGCSDSSVSYTVETTNLAASD